MPSSDHRRRSSSPVFDGPTIAVIVMALALLGAIGWWFWTNQQSPKEPQPPAEFVAPRSETLPEFVPPVPEAPPGPTEPETAEAAVPALADSDGAFRDEASSIFGADLVGRFLVSSHVIPRIVVTVDNLPRDKLPMRLRAVPKVDGRFVVAHDGEHIWLNSANAQRYRPLFGALASADMGRVAALYRRYYPMFQQAYQDLGYPDGSFNQRLIEVIDHLLATPEVNGAIELVQPKVFYRFADPRLEALSAGQKVLIRIGPEHAATVKSRLREFRAAIVATSPAS